MANQDELNRRVRGLLSELEPIEESFPETEEFLTEDKIRSLQRRAERLRKRQEREFS